MPTVEPDFIDLTHVGESECMTPTIGLSLGVECLERAFLF